MDDKLNQLKSWLNEYLLIARAYLGKQPTDDLVLRFVADGEVLTFHCTTSTGVVPEEGQYIYNWPTSSDVVPAKLTVMRKGILQELNAYEFGTTLISINPDYRVGYPPQVNPVPVVVVRYLSESGGAVKGRLGHAITTNPVDNNEFVPKWYVDALRADAEYRIGLLEQRLAKAGL